MKRLCSVVALVGGLVGALCVISAIYGVGLSGIQQASIASIGVGLAVIPYCISRTIQLLIDNGDAHALQQIQNNLVEIRAELISQKGVLSTGSHRAITTNPTVGETVTRPKSRTSPITTGPQVAVDKTKTNSSRWWKVTAAITSLALVIAGGTVLNYRWAHDLSTPMSLTDRLDIVMYACIIVGSVSAGILILSDAITAKTGGS